MAGDEVTKDKMVMAELSDIEVAGKVRMLMRSDLHHEPVCVAARDRIMYLSQRVEKLEKLFAAADKELRGDYNWELMKRDLGFESEAK